LSVLRPVIVGTQIPRQTPYLIRWSDGDRLLGRNVHITLQVKRPNNSSVQSAPTLGNVPNTGSYLVLQNFLNPQTANISPNVEYFFRIKNARRPAISIDSECFRIAMVVPQPEYACAYPSRRAHARQCVAALTQNVSDQAAVIVEQAAVIAEQTELIAQLREAHQTSTAAVGVVAPAIPFSDSWESRAGQQWNGRNGHSADSNPACWDDEIYRSTPICMRTPCTFGRHAGWRVGLVVQVPTGCRTGGNCGSWPSWTERQNRAQRDARTAESRYVGNREIGPSWGRRVYGFDCCSGFDGTACFR
jgi:hypothetical protein